MGSKNKEINYEKLLKKLDCPFNWGFDHIKKSPDLQYDYNNDKDYFPLLKLMHSITAVYVLAREGEDFMKIQEHLEKCEDSMLALKEKADPEISVEAANHILQSSKCFIYFKFEMTEKMQQVLGDINSIEALDKKGKSTLKACKGIVCFKSTAPGHREAETFIREAIEENSDCDLWYYLLGKILRKIRRSTAILIRPDEEIEWFKMAYEKSRNPVYGVFLAHGYRETGRFAEALQIYEDVFQARPESTTVILRMALGFMNFGNFERAKECLDKAEELCPIRSMYLHYRAMYYFKQHQYKEALPFYEEAIKDDNLPAERQYLQCKVKVDETFDVTGHLLRMLDKYKYLSKNELQLIILEVAFSYYKRDRKIDQALKYFLQAIEMDPNGKCLTNFYSAHIMLSKYKNIFSLLKKEALKLFEHKRSDFDEDTIEVVEKLKKYCYKNLKKD